MFVTLLLPIIVPYGCSGTFFDPHARFVRRTNFFRWFHSVNEQSRQYQQVQLLKSEDIEKHKNTIIEGEQKPQTKFVPSNVT
ncbi:hypothetical protein [Metabacillus niabensis]|uniref:hypothetical protein n=1 Tax=Metabacillus niabensis TaxID=324854 RepID=UPI0039A30BAC